MDAEQFQQFIEVFKTSFRTIQSPEASQVNNTLILNFEPYKIDAEKFSQYRERFENFAEMKNIHRDPSMMKRTFLNCVGSEIYETIKAINAPESIDKLSYIQIVESLEKYLSPRPNSLIEQHRFLSRVQDEKESIGEFVAALRKFLPTCEFNCKCGASIAELFLRAQFIRGLHNSAIRERLLEEKNLEFQNAVDKALAWEASRLNNQEIKKATSSGLNDINRISRTPFKKYENRYRIRSRDRSKPPFQSRRSRSKSLSAVDYNDLGIADLCIRCGRNNHLARHCRVSYTNLKCNSCHKCGHVSRVCISTLLRKKRNSDVKLIQSNDNSYADPNLTDYSSLQDLSQITVDLFSTTSDATDKYFITVFIEDRPQKFEVDSGCGFTLLSQLEFESMQLNIPLIPVLMRFRSYDAGIITPLGSVEVSVRYKKQTSKERLFIVPNGFSPILGRSWIRHLRVNLAELDCKGDS